MFPDSVLCKPVSLECNSKSSSAISSSSADVTIGVAEVVEAVFDRRSVTHSLKGFHLPIDNILPEYCEVSLLLSNLSGTLTSPSHFSHGRSKTTDSH